MNSGWLKTHQPFFHIPCGGWFRRKNQKHGCNMKGKKKKGKKGC